MIKYLLSIIHFAGCIPLWVATLITGNPIYCVIAIIWIIIWSSFTAWRNNAVCDFRFKTDWKDLKRMSDYDTMYHKFWIPLKKEYWLNV